MIAPYNDEEDVCEEKAVNVVPKVEVVELLEAFVVVVVKEIL